MSAKRPRLVSRGLVRSSRPQLLAVHWPELAPAWWNAARNAWWWDLATRGSDFAMFFALWRKKLNDEDLSNPRSCKFEAAKWGLEWRLQQSMLTQELVLNCNITVHMTNFQQKAVAYKDTCGLTKDNNKTRAVLGKDLMADLLSTSFRKSTVKMSRGDLKRWISG